MSVLLDLVIGLITIFLLFSIVVSGVNEWCAQAFARRGYFLRLGLQRLINDEAIYRRVLHHPLIGSLYRERAAKGKPPSYVDSNNFAVAIADVLLHRARTDADKDRPSPQLSIAGLREALQTPSLADSPVATALAPILDRAGNDLERALAGIEAWFNSAMDRVGGWYKARTQKILFAIGLVLAVACNVDAIEIFMALNHSPGLRAALVNTAEGLVKTGKVGEVNVTELKDRPPTAAEWGSLRPVFDSLRDTGTSRLPIGYSCLDLTLGTVNPGGSQARAREDSNPWQACANEFGRTWQDRSGSAWILKIVGWIVTAFAGTLGAAYWFGLLSKAVNLRGSGRKPMMPTSESAK